MKALLLSEYKKLACTNVDDPVIGPDDVLVSVKAPEEFKPLLELEAVVIGGLGGFGGLCRLPQGLRKPLLVSGTDGVGTKLELAQAHGRHQDAQPDQGRLAAHAADGLMDPRLFGALVFVVNGIERLNLVQLVAVHDVLRDIKVMDGFKLELFASEQEFPDLQNPVQMSFDNRGRLWVAENYSYAGRPTNLEPGLRDRVVVFEDADVDAAVDGDHLALRLHHVARAVVLDLHGLDSTLGGRLDHLLHQLERVDRATEAGRQRRQQHSTEQDFCLLGALAGAFPRWMLFIRNGEGRWQTLN